MESCPKDSYFSLFVRQTQVPIDGQALMYYMIMNDQINSTFNYNVDVDMLVY